MAKATQEHSVTNLVRPGFICGATVLSMLALPQAAHTQVAAKPLQFEVASVRRVEVTGPEFYAEVQKMRTEENATHRRTPWPSAAPAIHGMRVDMDGIVMRDLIS